MNMRGIGTSEITIASITFVATKVICKHQFRRAITATMQLALVRETLRPLKNFIFVKPAAPSAFNFENSELYKLNDVNAVIDVIHNTRIMCLKLRRLRSLRNCNI